MTGPSQGAPEPAEADSPIIASPHFEPYRGEEPWYYRFLVFYAYASLVIGMLGIGLVLVVSLMGAALVQRPAWAWLSIQTMIEFAFLALAIIFFAAVVLLGVDMGRSLRGIRRKRG